MITAVRLRVAACTWASENQLNILRIRTSELAKAIEGWGSCDVLKYVVMLLKGLFQVH